MQQIVVILLASFVLVWAGGVIGSFVGVRYAVKHRVTSYNLRGVMAWAMLHALLIALAAGGLFWARG